LQYKTEKDGVIETRIEKKVIVAGDAEDIDHDKVRVRVRVLYTTRAELKL